MGVSVDGDFTGAPESKKKKRKPKAKGGSAASKLVAMAQGRYLFGVTEDGQPYAVRPGQHVVRMLRGGKDSLRAELSQAYYQKHKTAAPQQALADAMLVLEGLAQTQDPRQVHLRVAKANGAVWLDLGDAAETAIQIDSTGWSKAGEGVPVLFRRTALTGVLPVPQAEGDLDLLWDHLNVAKADRPLVVAWLVAAVVDPEIPHPILAMFGEQGTGKSTASRRIVAVVDPSPVPLRKPPRDQESWVTAAQGSWVVGLDNLSWVPDWLSDSLCRAATGDGDVRRALYTDGSLAVFAFRRCVLLNGIDVGALRGDLADRIVKIDLERIWESDRLTERQLSEQWDRDYAEILGGLLSLAAEVIGVLSSLRLESSPRMADFALILAALDQLQGTSGLARFLDQAASMAEDSLSSNPFLGRMDELCLDFTGKAAELLAKVTPDADGWRPPRNWPKDPRAVTTLLRRNAPALRQAGWTVEGEQDRDHYTVWTLRHPEKAGISSPQGPQGPQSAETADDAENKYGQSPYDQCNAPTWRVCPNSNCLRFEGCVLR
jgi:hypothetical protein